ncbi:GNAT family N-acetyltransferase [Belliella kenyensis]|uniref:GNAT family N-acetyltransferase n=1 Tax=Belliella kenyensis TaxID=1472724 RepID=A0ABV8EMB5_9BACT|nr:GNAT family N-acetyltransferase [Belliella kenyensis]MCH7400384.1 GNAT family N-acetyltransferase [Belliella kenyensis]MDN3604598.1 GNAT family N-acetyltransferase [Belliella kenyensis]
MIEINTAQEHELISIQEMADIIWPRTFDAILSKDQISYMMTMMYDLEKLKYQFHSEAHVFLIAKEGSDNLGFCVYQSDGQHHGKTKIHKIYLMPEAQGKGLGRMLINEVITHARINHSVLIYLNVNVNNTKAIAAYKAIGFKETKREVIDIGNGYVMDDIVMEMPII